AGTWNVESELVADAAGNTQALSTTGLTQAGFPTTLNVTSTTDTTAPVLTSFGFSPTSINTTSSSANVLVSFAATDDLSGVKSFQVAFLSPSGSATQSATVTLTPSTSVSGSATITFPKLSEAGTWTVSSVFLADDATNTLILDSVGVASKGF